MKCGALAAALLAIWTCAASARVVPIAARGEAKCVVVTQPGATVAERYAAQELATWLGQVTGARFEVREVTRDAPEDAIVVGPGAVAAAAFPDVDLTRFGGEEYAIRTMGHRMLLAGGRPRGTLYAVYRYLQDQVGVRWWTPWATRIPKRPTLSAYDLSLRGRPAFEYREPFWYSAFDGAWAARNGANSSSARLGEQHGGRITYRGFVHTYYPLVPPDQHFDTHPEWYSLVGGQRRREGAQLCTSNPELRDFVVERVKQWLRESPEARIVSVSQNDCAGACECARCTAIDDREGTKAGSVLELANYVGARIAREFPEVAVDTLAYQYTRRAPKALKPLPNVIVRLCSIECNFAEPLSHPSNAKFADDIRAWSKLTNRLYVWDYTTNFAHYTLPHPNWFSLGTNVRFFNRNGVRGLFEQGAYQSFGSEMGDLRAWVLAQQLWNPYRRDRRLIDEFLVGYYGKPSAPYVRAYIDLMAKAAKGYNLGCFNAPANSPFLSFETLAQAERLWQQAEEAASVDSDLLWRVRQGRLPVWYAWLVRWPALRRECARAGADWPMPASRAVLADRWLLSATGQGPTGWSPMTLINEGGITPQTFAERMRLQPAEPSGAAMQRLARPALPTDIALAEQRAGVDVQDAVARLYNEPELAEQRSDPAASDLSAIWMPGKTREWACQVEGGRLPKRCQAGRWKVYVAVRVERTPGAVADAPAFTAGVYDNANQRHSAGIGVSVGQAGDGYRTYALGTVDMSDSQHVWVAPPGTDAVKAVWVDRVFLVPGDVGAR